MCETKSNGIAVSEEIQEKLSSYLAKWKHMKGNLMPLLNEIQRELGYVPREWAMELSKMTDFSLAEIYEVLTFYSYFKLKPQGKHKIQVCTGTACHVKGAPKLIEALEKHLGVKAGGITEDKCFQLDTVRCVGACGLAPTIVVDDEVVGKCTSEKVVEIVKNIQEKEISGAEK